MVRNPVSIKIDGHVVLYNTQKPACFTPRLYLPNFEVNCSWTLLAKKLLCSIFAPWASDKAIIASGESGSNPSYVFW